MSADEFGERTQQPTERRRREVRARGEVARSANLVVAVVLLVSTSGIWWLAPSVISELAGFMQTSLSSAPPAMMNEEIVAAGLVKVTKRLATTLVPILMLVIGAAAVSNLVQTGFLWAPSALLPRFDRIDPARQMTRCWSAASWLGFGASAFRLAILLAVLILFVRSRLATARPLVEGQPAVMLAVTIRSMGELGVLLSISLVLLAAIDYGWQYWRFEQSLKMTVEEVLREQREENGDPRLRRQRRDLTKSQTTRMNVQELDGIGQL